MSRPFVRTLALGTAALATAATLSLTTPTPALAAPSDAAVPSEVSDGRLTGPFVLAGYGDGAYAVVKTPVAGSNLGRLNYSADRLEEAVAAASRWTFPPIGGSGPVRGAGATSSICLEMGPEPVGTRIVPQRCADRPKQRFSWVDVGAGWTLVPEAAADRYIAASSGSSFVLTSTPSAAATLVLDYMEGRLSAKVDSIDRAAKTAQISGTAVPNAGVIIDGVREVTADGNGRWSTTVENLGLGSNIIELTQWEKGVQTGEFTLDVPIEVSPVTAVTSFPALRGQNAKATGTAHPGATIVITDDTDTEIARTTAATTPTGPWQTEIPAPGRGGDYTIRIHQEIDGEKNGRIDRTVSYGEAVAITSPVDDMAHDGGPVAMTGRGEIGATVEVREEGRATILGTATVLSNRAWNLRTTSLDAAKHTLVATQLGRGANTTTAAVTLNPEADDTGRDLAVTSHRNGDPFAPSGLTTLRGKATPDSSVTVFWFGEANPQLATTVPTNSVGDWAASRGLGGTRPYDLTIAQDPRPGVVNRITGFTLTPPTTGPANLTVTSHRDGDPFAATGVTTLSGQATPDSTVTVYWFGTENDSPALTTRATAGPTGAWTASRGLGGTRPYLVDIRQTPRQPGVVNQIDDLRLVAPR